MQLTPEQISEVGSVLYRTGTYIRRTILASGGARCYHETVLSHPRLRWPFHANESGRGCLPDEPHIYPFVTRRLS